MRSNLFCYSIKYYFYVVNRIFGCYISSYKDSLSLAIISGSKLIYLGVFIYFLF